MSAINLKTFLLHSRRMRSKTIALAFLLASPWLEGAELHELLAAPDVRPGLLAVAGVKRPESLPALRNGAKFLVHALCDDAAIVTKTRQELSKANLYGPVSVELHDLKSLPYADDMVNVIVVEDFETLQKSGLTLAEVLRALAPYGSAFLKGLPLEALKPLLPEGEKNASLTAIDGWVRLTKPYPSDMDQWSHYFYDASNSVASNDARMGWPDQLRFMAGRPFAGNSGRWCSGFTSANGRNYYSSPVEPGDLAPPKSLTMLECRDAFNGALLWRRFLTHAPLWYHWSLTGYPADAERVYTQYSGGLAALDTVTGADAWRIADPEGDGQSLVLAADGAVIRNGRSVRAFDAATGKSRWRLDTKNRPALIAMGGGKVFAALIRPPDPVEVVCVELKDGQEIWKAKLTELPEIKDIALWNVNLNPMQYRAGRLFLTCRSGANGVPSSLAVLSAADGKISWTGKRASGHPLCLVDDKVFDSLTTFDPETGAKLGSVKVNGDANFRGSCGVTFGSRRFLIAGRLGFIDRQTGEAREYQLTRGGCTQGAAIPANGLSNFTRQTCTCFTLLQGHLSFASNVAGRTDVKITPEARLEKGPAFGLAPAPPKADAEFGSWPTLRQDAQRGGSTRDHMPGMLAMAWTQQAAPDASAPVSDGNIVCVACASTHQVKAFSVADGRPVWSFTAGGPVDSPPTLAGGYAVFGCRDGSVYALNAADGRLAWRHIAAPAMRRIISFDQVESSWPVIGSVVVQDNVVFAAAGRHTQVDGGLRVVALDLATGSEVWSQSVGGRNIEQAFVNDVLRVDGPRVYLTGFMGYGPMGKFGFDRATGKPWRSDMTAAPKGSMLSAEGGLLVDGRYRMAVSVNHTELRRIWWYVPNLTKPSYPGSPSGGERFPMKDAIGYRGDLIAFDGNRVFGAMRTYGDHIAKDPDFPEHSSHASKLILYGPTEKRLEPWCFDPRRSAYDLRGLVATRTRVFAAFASPSAESPKAVLMSVDAETGLKDEEISLPAAPRWDGMAVAAGRLFITTEDGRILCLWQPVTVNEEDWVFASGAKVERTLRVSARADLPCPLTIRWSVDVDGKVAGEGTATFARSDDIPATVPVRFVLPQVDASTTASFSLVVKNGDKIVCEEKHALRIINGNGAAIPKIPAVDLTVWDPSGEAKARLKSRGLAFSDAANLAAIPDDAKVVLVGRNALTAENATDGRWKKLAEAGARIVILDQEFPLDAKVLGSDAKAASGELRRAQLVVPGHGIMAGLDDLDFARWTEDGILTRMPYIKGSRFVRSWLDSPRGRSALIAEFRLNSGTIVASQACLSGRLAADPVCQRLFDNLLSHAIAFRPTQVASTLAAGSSRAELLKETGLVVDEAGDPITAMTAARHNLIIVDAAPALLKALAEKPELLRDYTARGGWLVLWGLAPDGLADFNKLAGVEHLMRRWEPARISMPAKPDPLVASLNAADFNLRSRVQFNVWLPDANAWTFVVDAGDIAPFCSIPGPEYWKHGGTGANTDTWPRNMFNGFTSQDDWRLGFSIHLDKKAPASVPLTLPREEQVSGFSLRSSTRYQAATRVRVSFDDRKEDAIELDVKPASERQDFNFPPRPAKKVTLEFLDWTRGSSANVIGIDNIWLRAERTPDFKQRVQPLLDLGVLVKYPIATGGIVLNQMEPQLAQDATLASKAETDRRAENRGKQKRILTALLWNMGASLQEPAPPAENPEVNKK